MSKKYNWERIPCSHPGCLSHVTHPCEGCGRIAGKPQGPDYSTRTEIRGYRPGVLIIDDLEYPKPDPVTAEKIQEHIKKIQQE